MLSHSGPPSPEHTSLPHPYPASTPTYPSAGLKSNLPRKQSHLSEGTGQVTTSGALKFCFNGRFVASSVGNSGWLEAHLPTQ